MSFFSKLFGGGNGGEPSAPKTVAEADHNGFHIATTPINEGGQFRVSALITKEVGGEAKAHRLIRADVCSSADEASDMALRKAKQIIDEQGERIF
ncbi:MAG: HlyU family transcriptional regulator [Rhizobiaceae bacterium]|nr:HlyU family transcriptional regulator [Rhizobiaceae bacterium]